MNRGKLGIAFAVGVVTAAPALAGEELQIGAAPPWVEVAQRLPDPDEENALPARLVFLDSQVRFDEDSQSNYSNLAIKFQTAEGLSGGNLQFAWRPETQDLTIHKVLIHRGDETIDVLESGQTFTVLRREQNLEMAMLDGTLTATMFPEGLQVGDVLEFASTIVDRDPVTAGHAEVSMGPVNHPVDHLSFKVEWPEGRQVNLARTDDLPDWRRSRKGGTETVEFALRNVEPLALPRLAPVRYSMVRFAEATEFSSWADVAALEIPLYAKAAKVPAAGPLRTEVERIREASSDPVARTEAALALVQSRIRYVALAIGTGGLVPADAEQTWLRRYGDCKAKTALLLAILDELGIEAEGVAVHTDAGDVVSKRLPSIGAFNHILVRARIDGREYWLDGTRTGDTSLAKLQVPDFGWGLPIVENARLVAIVPAPLEQPVSDLVIHMDASKGVHAPVPTKVEQIYRGDFALMVNQEMANYVGEARDRTLREFWRRRFNSITPEKVGMTFDGSGQELVLSLEGKAAMEWNGVWYETDETGLAFEADFTREDGPARDAPFAVGHPFYTRTRQTIVLPPGFIGPNQDSNVEETVAGVEYKRTILFANDTATIEASERSVAPEFPAADAPAFQKRLRELAADSVYLKIPNGYRPTPADLEALGKSDNQGHADLLAEGNQLLNAGRFADAADKFKRATELEPEDVWSWANLGVALARQRKLAEAEVALDRANAIDPNNTITYNGRGIVAEWRRDYDGAAAAYIRALEIDPTNGFARSGRTQARLNVGKVDLAMQELAAEARQNPKELATYGLRAFLLLNAQRRDEVPQVLEEMLAANGDDPAARQMAARMYADLGMSEKAQELAGSDGPVTPSPMFYINRAAERAANDSEGRLADLTEALRIEPSFQSALLARAQVLQELGRTDEALADTEVALQNNPMLSDVYVMRANILKSAGRRDAAIKEAEALVTANPDETFARVAAGKIYSAFDMRTEALAEMDRALAIMPEAFIYINRSQVRDQDDIAGRLADLDEALKLSSDDTTALYMKASLLDEQGDHEAAAEVMALASRSRPDDAGLVNSRGISLARAGRTEEAESAFDAARKLANDAMTLNNICYTKVVANVALERALEECEASLELRPDFGPTLDSRGAALLRLGRLEEAIRDFDRVLEQMPTMSNSRYLRAVALSQKGETATAEKDLEAVREKSPELIEYMEKNGFVLAGG